MKNKENKNIKIYNFLTEITYEDFKDIARKIEIKSIFNNKYDEERNLLKYILNHINNKKNNFLIALHTNFEEDCYFDKELGTLNIIYIECVEKVLRNRDYWMVFCDEGNIHYEIPRKETQSIYYIHID